MSDAGAERTLDFTAAGHPSTYLVDPDRVEQILRTLTSQLASSRVDAVVMEVADGLFQAETAALASSPVFRAGVDLVLFAAHDALGAAAGVESPRRRGLPVAALSGLLTSSPLAAREAERATGLPVIGYDELRAPDGATALLERAAASVGALAA